MAFLVFDLKEKLSPDNKVVTEAVRNGYTLSWLDLVKMDSDGDVYLPSLDVAYADILRVLFDLGYTCTPNAYKLSPCTFNIFISNNSCSHIDICHKNNTILRIMSFRAKTGLSYAHFDEMSDIYSFLDILYLYGLNRSGLGADAYAAFLASVFGHNDESAYTLVRSIFPILPYSFGGAKRLVAGYQTYAQGMYENVYSYDIHRAYTYSMRGEIPQGLPMVYDGYRAPRGNQWSIYECVFAGKKPAANGIDWLPPETTHGTLWLPQRLYDDAQRDYTFDFFTVSHTFAFKTRAHRLDPFLELYGDMAGPLKKYSKRLCNALVGYLGRNPRENKTIFKRKNNEIARETVNMPSKAIYPPAYICLLDRHKSRFLAMLRAAGGTSNIIYANTDGFMTRHPINLSRFNVGLDGVQAGSLQLRDVYRKVYIEKINQYAAERSDGTLDNCISGARLTRSVSPADLAERRIAQYIDMLGSDGFIHRTFIDHS